MTKTREDFQPYTDPVIPNIKDYFEGVKNRKPRPAYIEELVPQKPGEIVVIAGKTGIGKTILGLHLGFCLSTGTPFEGFKCQKIIVGFLSLEGDDSNMMDRYNKIHAQYPDTGENFRFELLEKKKPTALMREVEMKLDGCDVVIFDGSRYLVRGDYCKPKDTRDFLTDFMVMLRSNSIVAIMSLQIKKPDNRYLATPGDIYSIKGATELVDDATTAMLLERTPQARNKLHTTLYFSKTRMASREIPDLAG